MSIESVGTTPAPATERPRPLEPGEAAWIAALPVAVVVVLLAVLLGPPLGELLQPSGAADFWTEVMTAVQPEPTERARYLLLLSGPLLLGAATIALARSRLRLGDAEIGQLVLGAQVVAALGVVMCFVAQWSYRFPFDYAPAPVEPRTVYFTLPSLLVALAGAALATWALHSPRRRARLASALSPGRGWTVAVTAVVVLATALTLLPAVTTDDAVMAGNELVSFHLSFVYDEAMAVLGGRSPLRDFATQYGALWPYATAAGMELLGDSIGVFTTLMALISGCALLALYAVLRRVARSAVAGAVLFLPLLATSAWTMRGPLDDRYSLVNLFGAFPLRYAGPFLLVWLTARHLDGARPRRAWPLFLAGGLVALNNVDFGIAAIGATLAALLAAGGRPTGASLRRLALDAVLGLAAAGALVTLWLLVRTGAPPDLGMLTRYARLFALEGYGMLPVRPVVGVSTAIYLTYVAAFATAIARATRDAPDRLLTGLLAWAAIFGLGAGAYYVGRSHPEVLTTMLPPWALAVTLLTVAVVRGLAREPRGGRRLLPAFACFAAVGLLVCSLAQTPRPWGELERLRETAPRSFAEPPGQLFVDEQTEPGEHVAILIQLGHRIAANVGVEDVTPYTGAFSMFTREQLDETLDALRDEGGRKVFLSVPRTYESLRDSLLERGFERTAATPDEQELWIAPAGGSG